MNGPFVFIFPEHYRLVLLCYNSVCICICICIFICIFFCICVCVCICICICPLIVWFSRNVQRFIGSNPLLLLYQISTCPGCLDTLCNWTTKNSNDQKYSSKCTYSTFWSKFKKTPNCTLEKFHLSFKKHILCPFHPNY